MERAAARAIFDQLPGERNVAPSLQPCFAPARPRNIYSESTDSRDLKGSQGTPESWRSSQFTAGRSDWPRSAQGSAQVKQEGVIPGLQAAGLTNSDHFLEISDHFLTSRPNHLSSSKIVPFPLQFWLKLLPFHHLHKG